MFPELILSVAVKFPKREAKNKRSNPESLSLRQEIANRNLKRQRTEGKFKFLLEFLIFLKLMFFGS